MNREEKIALLKEMYHKYDFTSEEQNLLAEMFETWGAVQVFNSPGLEEHHDS